ncbi:unnamed protein product, partial [Rotaria sordida]
QNQMMSLFYSTTKWQQINLWLKTLLHIIDPSVDDYMFLIREKKTILDNDQMTLVQITKYDDEEQIKVPLLNRNITIEKLLHSTEKSIDVYKYLATNDTKRILDSNEKLSNLNKTKFILVKENEMCLVLIKKSNDLQLIHVTEEESEKYQRFVVSATIADINKENQQDILHQYLLYSNDFVPSTAIQLITFQSESLIQFI